MVEQYFTIKYFEYIIGAYLFIGLFAVMFVTLLVACIIDFIERHKGNKHGNRM